MFLITDSHGRLAGGNVHFAAGEEPEDLFSGRNRGKEPAWVWKGLKNRFKTSLFGVKVTGSQFLVAIACKFIIITAIIIFSRNVGLPETPLVTSWQDKSASRKN